MIGSAPTGLEGRLFLALAPAEWAAAPYPADPTAVDDAQPLPGHRYLNGHPAQPPPQLESASRAAPAGMPPPRTESVKPSNPYGVCHQGGVASGRLMRVGLAPPGRLRGSDQGRRGPAGIRLRGSHDKSIEQVEDVLDRIPPNEGQETQGKLEIADIAAPGLENEARQAAEDEAEHRSQPDEDSLPAVEGPLFQVGRQAAEDKDHRADKTKQRRYAVVRHAREHRRRAGSDRGFDTATRPRRS